MKRLKLLGLLGLAAGLLALAAVACGSSTNPAPAGASAPTGQTANTLSATELASVAKALGASVSASSSQGSGIWVTGTGKEPLKPDLGVVNLGVQAEGKTVAEARETAARAMSDVLAALKALGIADKDIQTQYFSVQPKYSYRQVERCPEPAVAPAPSGVPLPPDSKVYGCWQESEQVLVGYQVANQATVKVRNLDLVGQVVDSSAQAGGDAIRINSIYFTIEDSSAAQVKAREEAVKEALAKAQQFAQLTGVTLGKLVYITESGGSVPPMVRAEAAKLAGAPSSDVTTPISAGELEVSVSVQAVFAIE